MLVLSVIAFNLTRAAATLTGPALTNATTGTVRRKLIALPARIARSAPPHHPPPARRLALGSVMAQLFTHACGPPTSHAS